MRTGDLVYSVDHGAVRAVALIDVAKREVHNHRVMEITLSNGLRLDISALHPTADGRTFGQLHAGDRLDTLGVVSATSVPYLYSFTYDIMPDSDTGTYFAGGALIGSTLAPPVGPACRQRTP